MIKSFHELRRHEEGQALVLAAISMLILTLCVLTTINLTFAAEQKVKLQNAADDAAYTTAAYEARALNFLAYSNRTMIVQYSSQMNLMALVTYFIFNLNVTYLIYKMFQAVPYLSIIFLIIYIIYAVITWVIFLIVLVTLPLIDGLNYGFSLAQVAIVNALQPMLAAGPVKEVQAANPNYTVSNLSESMLNVNDSLRWGPTGSMVAVTPIPNLVPQTTGQLGYDRLMMVEMVNASRNAWTAYGGDNGGASIFSWLLGIPRRAEPPPLTIGFPGFFGITLELGKQGRTEWGALTAGARNVPGLPGFILGLINGLAGGLFTPTEELFSLDRFFLTLTISLFGFSATGGFAMDSYAYADRGTLLDDFACIFSQNSTTCSHNVLFTPIRKNNGPGGIFGAFIKAALNAFLDLILTPLLAAARDLDSGVFSPPSYLPLIHFGMMPYARFRPTTVAQAGKPSATELFNQPPVLQMVTMPKAALAAIGQPFLGPTQGWGFRIGGLRAGNSDGLGKHVASKQGYVDKLTYQPWASNEIGLPLPGSMADGGMIAISGAMAYYHRPGDWREPPNLFNPMWGAKLMPVTDYPAITTGFNALKTYLNSNLIVH